VVAKAKEYVGEPKGWFYMGGQVGCGKTHICTSIVRELIEAGNEARYMLWREVSTKLKACVNNPEEYAGIIEPLKTVKVLYIDDFWKTNTDKPTTADANLAFEILNARYNRKDLITIISSEYYLCELADIDEAVGSRIYERAKENRLDIARDKSRNYRSRGMSKMI
jgi:DNA replication protein DnaC